ncbi:hypothetical protein [Paracoccus versutus]
MSSRTGGRPARSLIIALDPRIIGGTDALPHIERLAAAIEAQPHARIPGSRRIALRQAAAAKGIDLPEAPLSRIE